jgi:hypothetical protein
LQSFDHASSNIHRAIKEPNSPPDRSLSNASTATSESTWTYLPGEGDQQIAPQHQIYSVDDHARSGIRRDESTERLLKGKEAIVTRSRSLAPGYETSSSTKLPAYHPTAWGCSDVKSQAHGRKFVRRYWLWEISASILSLACIASVIGVLMYEDGKPLRQWGLGQKYLAPNVVVSFLGTLAKSACLLAVAEVLSQLKWLHFHKNPQNLSDLQLFDDASRGPWGAIRLAICKHRKSLLATCGSIIIVASLLIDPFIQSAFQFPSILTPIQGRNPVILSSQRYDSSSWVYSACEFSGLLSTALQDAVLAPIYNATKEPSLPCGFERCEWPTITTLGVCSSCIDLTHTIESECTGQSTIDDREVITSSINCNYTHPKSDRTFNFVFDEEKGNTSTPDSSSTVWNSDWETDSLPWLPVPDDLHFRSRPAILSNFTYLQFDDSLEYSQYLETPGSLENPGGLISDPPVMKAMQCALQFCSRTFENPYFGNFTAGGMTGPQVRLNMSTNSTLLEQNSTIFLGLEPESTTSSLMNMTYHINNCDFYNLMFFMRSLFTATLDSRGYVGSTEDASAGPNQSGQWSVATIGMALSQFDDIPALMQRMADSMTEAFRTSRQSTPTNGVALQSEVLIAINWTWLTLPISVTIFAFFLLLTVIHVNNTSGISPWKSSSLALLFHELDGWDDNKNMILDGPDKVEARAKEMRAQVTYQDDQLRFTKAD